MDLDNSEVVLFLKEIKIDILKSWLQNKDIISIFQKYGLDREYFVRNFGVYILDYYIDMIKNNKFSKCATMNDLLIYLKQNEVIVEALFILCLKLKSTLFSFINKHKEYCTFELIELVTYFFERNLFLILKKYNEEMKEVESKLASSLDIVDHQVIISRTNLEGEIIYASDAFCKISGYSQDELIGQSHNIVKHPDMKEQVFKELWNTIKKGEVFKGEIKNKKKNGDFYWVDVTIEAMRNKDDEIIGYNAIRQDITSKKEVQEQQHVLVEQSKSAAMGEMISMIAHQWRQPLQAVSILIQKLPLTKMIDGEITDEVLDQVVDDIGQQLEYMSKTIDDFRDFFRPDKRKEKIEVYKLIDKARDFLAYMLKVDTIKFNIVKGDEYYLDIHINEVVQVLINIIKNARDAMIEKKKRGREIEISYFLDNDYVVIEIEDNAGGIEDSVMGKIFEPYFSTKSNKNGTGLGLYMSKTIIENHSNGILSVRNGEDGAIFKIEIPIQKRDE